MPKELRGTLGRRKNRRMNQIQVKRGRNRKISTSGRSDNPSDHPMTIDRKVRYLSTGQIFSGIGIQLKSSVAPKDSMPPNYSHRTKHWTITQRACQGHNSRVLITG